MLERNPKPLPRLAVAALVAVGLATLLPWRVEARQIPQATRKKEVPAAKKNDPDGLMKLLLQIQIERARAEMRRLEGELRNVQEGKPRFDAKGYRLIQKRNRAEVAAELALANAAQQARKAEMVFARQALARAARSLETARRAGTQAKRRHEIESRKADQARAEAAGAIRRARETIRPTPPKSLASGAEPRVNSAQNKEGKDSITLRNRPVLFVVTSAKGDVKIYRSGDEPPYQYQVERVSKAATSVPAATATKKP